MRKILFIILCCFSLQFFAQEHQLAYQYFRNGEYEKAAEIYKSLHEKNNYNTTYLNYLIDCYQQLESFDKVDLIVNKQLKSFENQEYLWVELGYNLQLQHKQQEAEIYYNKALKSIDKNNGKGYLVGKTFQYNHLLDYALKAYHKEMELNPRANYNFQIAAIYGEKAETKNMFNTYLNIVDGDDIHILTIKNYLGRFITADAENKNNKTLKILLIKKLQNNPQNSWNQLLSWLFMQQKEYSKALTQEKALYKRNKTDLSNILEIGEIAFRNKDYEASKNSFHYILENTTDLETKLSAKLFLLEINVDTNAPIEEIENQFQELFTEYGKNESTLNIQAVYAEFVTFKKNDSKKAISILKEALKLTGNQFQKGYLKTKLADILVFSNKFNSALIYYSQVQTSLKNHTIGQTARFKIAQTSYFKGDFDWAQSQLKILKKSTSQLIANDALDLNLLITDNIVKDSLKLALKKYATADLYAFQNKNKQAINTLQIILDKYKGHPIEDEALFKQAKLLEKLNEFEKAENNYLQIIKLNTEDILADDANYYLAELYLNKLNNPEKAKEYYQKIIFDYPSSIYLVDARKKYRKLRGDHVN